MFKITSHKGFQMTFANGCTVSVQWGPGNYCQHYGSWDHAGPQRAECWSSDTAEVAAWNADNQWHDFGCDTVEGRLTADEVVAFITMVQRDGVKPEKKRTEDTHN